MTFKITFTQPNAWGTIEYGPGLFAKVAAVPSEGTNCACGGFVIQTDQGFALCWMDLEADDEEVWFYDDEENPFVSTLEQALARYDAGPPDLDVNYPSLTEDQ